MNRTTKYALFGAFAYGGFLLLNNKSNLETHPNKRKHMKGFSANHIDHQLNDKNKISRGNIPLNSKVPFYSRHNYNRRRRALHKPLHL